MNLQAKQQKSFKEDIMNSKKFERKRIDGDLADFSKSNQVITSALNDNSITTTQGKHIRRDSDRHDEIKIVLGTNADVTKDDLSLLKEKNTDLGENSGEDLDISGSDKDNIGE